MSADKKYRNKSWLKKKYIEQDMTQEEISNIFNVNQTTISTYVNKYDLNKWEKQKTLCPECNEEVFSIGGHWHHFPSHRPSLSRKQKDILTGIVMGDGNVHSPSGQNPRVVVYMINKEFLHHLNDVFECISTGVSLSKTAKEKANEDKRSGFNPKANEENYNDFYYWGTVRHPELSWLRGWYSTGEKLFPKSISMNETIFKYWYVCDGSLRTDASTPFIRVGCLNEIDNKEKLINIFKRSDLPVPTFSEYIGEDENNLQIKFSVEKSKTIFDKIGNPLPGFEHKWPDYSKDDKSS